MAQGDVGEVQAKLTARSAEVCPRCLKNDRSITWDNMLGGVYVVVCEGCGHIMLYDQAVLDAVSTS